MGAEAAGAAPAAGGEQRTADSQGALRGALGRPLSAVHPSSGGGEAAAVAAGELWLAIHLPAIALDAVCREGDRTGAAPVAVVETMQRVQRIVVANRAARARGVAPGMAPAAALALEPRLDIRPRAAGAESALLERLAAAAGEVTPRVSLEPPDGVLLEVRGSLALFGGVDALFGKVTAAARGAGAHVRLALAPTPLAALAGARARRDRTPFRVMHRAELVGALAPLPLAALRLPEETITRLAKVGVGRIGEALRLPRAGLARRFGPEALAALDRLVGRETEPRRVVAPREHYRARREPSYELTGQPAIIAFLAPMLAELEAFLRARQASLTVLECRLHHRDGAATHCRLRFAQPAFAAAAIGFLLGERLATTALAAPVTACELVSGRLVPRQSASAALWQPGEHGGGPANEAPALIERLRARLGEDSVYSLCLVPEHRPEAAARRVAAGGQRANGGQRAADDRRAPADVPGRSLRAARPLWLLSTPLLLPALGAWPQYEGPLEKVAGPERIETGWWDGRDVTRDYYVMRSRTGAQLWVYRERRPPHEWFLHGVFG